MALNTLKSLVVLDTVVTFATGEMTCALAIGSTRERRYTRSTPGAGGKVWHGHEGHRRRLSRVRGGGDLGSPAQGVPGPAPPAHHHRSGRRPLHGGGQLVLAHRRAGGAVDVGQGDGPDRLSPHVPARQHEGVLPG